MRWKNKTKDQWRTYPLSGWCSQLKEGKAFAKGFHRGCKGAQLKVLKKRVKKWEKCSSNCVQPALHQLEMVLGMYAWKIITGRENGTQDQIVSKAAAGVPH